MTALLLLALLQGDPVDRYFHLLDAGLDYSSRAEFKNNYPKLAESLRAEGLTAAEMEALLFRGEKPGRGLKSPDWRALAGGSAKEGSVEFRAVTGCIARALLETFYDPVARERALPCPMDDALSEFGAIDWPQAYARLSQDRTFLTHMARAGVKGPEVKRSGKPEFNPRPQTPAEWAAFVRWSVGEDRQNADIIDQAIRASPDEAYFRFLRAYYLLFDHKEDAGLAALKEGLSSKSYDPRTPEILDSLAAAFDGPLRYFGAIYSIRTPHEDQFYDLATTHLSMLVESFVGDGKPDKALEMLDLGLGFLERIRPGAAMLGEIVQILKAKRRLLDRAAELFRGKDEANYWKAQRAKADVEWELAAIDFGSPVTDEFMMMAAGLVLDDESLGKYWGERRKARFDADRVAQAVKRLRETVLPRLDKEPELGGSEKDELFLQARKHLEAGRPKLAAETAGLVLQTNPRHLRALLLKRQALSKID